MAIQSKKILKTHGLCVVFLVVLFVLSGTLCALAGDTSAKTPYQGVTLTFAIETGPPFEYYYGEMVPEFERRTGIKVKVDAVPIAEMVTKLTTEFMAETGAYDAIGIVVMPLTMFLKNGWIEPLEPFFEQGVVSPGYDLDDFASKEGMYVDDKLVTLPITAFCKTFFYRTDLFGEAGLPGPPETFAEEIEYARKLNNPPIYGTVLHGRHYAGTMSVVNTMLHSSGGQYYDENWNPVFDREAGVAALTHYVNLLKYAPPDVLNYGWLEVGSAFAQGNAAMCRLYPDSMPDFIDPEKSRIVGKFNMTIPPPRKGYPARPHGGTQGFQVASQSRHKKAAFKLIEFLTSKEIEQKLALAGKNGSPPRLSTMAHPEYTKMAWWAPVVAEGLKVLKMPPCIESQQEVDEALLTAWENAAVGKQSPQEALSTAAEEVRKVLRAVGYLQ